jgi:FHS family L-fucose permease-like MFS transporter
LAPLVVLTSLFFMWGFLTCLNDIIIPHLKGMFELTYAQAMLVQFAFFAAYFVMSLPAGAVVRRLGYKGGIVAGLVVAATGCAGFHPAAGVRSYGLFLFALFVLASGITLLQVAANPFVAALGKPESAPARLTLTQAFNALGTTIAPLFGSALILSHPAPTNVNGAGSAAALEAYRASEAASVQGPYLGLTLMLLILAGAIALSRLPRIHEEPRLGAKLGFAALLREPHLTRGALAIFLYVGAEVAIGSLLVSFLQEPSIGGMSEASAARLVALYWGGAMVGRFVGTVTLRRFQPGKVLSVHAACAAALLAVVIGGSGKTAVYAVLAVGLCNSVMFPTIFALAIAGLGARTSQASGLLCMAIVGGALVPLAQGALADASTVQASFLIALLCRTVPARQLVARFTSAQRRSTDSPLVVTG